MPQHPENANAADRSTCAVSGTCPSAAIETAPVNGGYRRSVDQRPGSALHIGSVKLDNRLILAPMAGITDRPFRSLCRRLGAGLAVSEMVTAKPALRATRKSSERADHIGEPGPIAVQIAGSDPVEMAEAARFNLQQGADIIDINLGCPAKKVCKSAAGAVLLRNEALVGRILNAVTRAVPIPVTLKTRTGWSPESRNLLRIARIAKDSGIAMLTVHGRTRACGYRGAAEFESLRELRGMADLDNLVLVANGDIDSPQRALEVLNHTGADAVMIGRASRGRPWLFRQIAHFLDTGSLLPEPVPEWIRDTLLAHLEALYGFYGETRGVRIARKHIAWYCCNSGTNGTVMSGRPTSATIKQYLDQANRAETAQQQREIIIECFRQIAANGGAHGQWNHFRDQAL